LLPLVGVSVVFGGTSFFAEGPPASRTGAIAIGAKPAEGICTQCHHTVDANGDPVDNFNTPGGGVQILDVPTTYVPGTTYPLRVHLASDSTAQFPDRRWGFELTAVRASDGEGAGSFVLPPGDTLKVKTGFTDFSSRSYIEHTFVGTRVGLASPVEWAFEWQAPATDVGRIYFFCAGNAASGNLGDDGDFIYTTVDSTGGESVPVARMSWGALKARFR